MIPSKILINKMDCRRDKNSDQFLYKELRTSTTTTSSSARHGEFHKILQEKTF